MATGQDSGADAARAPKTENTTAELRRRLQSLVDGIRTIDELKGDCGDENIPLGWALKRLSDEAHDANAFLGSI